MKNRKSEEVIVFLDNIRSVYNVGAIFRTADAFGISEIILSGITPMPNDRFGRPRADFAKSALGSEYSVPWIHAKNPIPILKKLKSEGFQIISVEQNKKSVDYRKLKLKGKYIIVFGNEIDGVSKKILKISDTIAEIPMKGMKESLNVSVTAGIVLSRQ
ncbi:MAG TPA: TrmH family RNA methyltransferase [Candidatus Paceibacterota bacterium]|nr:TrmH family RNA methyltransferase [Candidatus Paceibacterota bacterium]